MWVREGGASPLTCADPGGRIIKSAPTPRVRRAVPSSVPKVTPTRVRIIATSTAIANTLRTVRTGRWARLESTSLLIKEAFPCGALIVQMSVGTVIRTDRENPVVSHAEVDHGTTQNRDAIGDEHGHMRLMDQNLHQRKIAHHGNEAIGEMKAHQLSETRGAIAAVSPSEVQVGNKVVQ